MMGFCCLAIAAALLRIQVQLSTQVYHTDHERASFMETKNDNRLLLHVFKTLPADSFIDCIGVCLKNEECKSVNYFTINGAGGGTCELNDITLQEINSNDQDLLLVREEGWLVAWWLNLQVQTYTFTTLGAQGGLGPNNTDGYVGTNLEGAVQLNNGTQLWKTPLSGNYIIEAKGASGGNGTEDGRRWTLGGKGAKLKGTFSLEKGVLLKILVGQMAVMSNWERIGYSRGGGGGSFVAMGVLGVDNTPLIVAGGGGGGGILSDRENRDGDAGQVTTNGSRHGGHDGGGGRTYNNRTGKYLDHEATYTSTGAGFYKDGEGVLCIPSQSFVNGGRGAVHATNGMGGFGGGGSSINLPMITFPGGGGGYSGGGVLVETTDGGFIAGGGGSYNKGADQQNVAGANEGDGEVRITLVI